MSRLLARLLPVTGLTVLLLVGCGDERPLVYVIDADGMPQRDNAPNARSRHERVIADAIRNSLGRDARVHVRLSADPSQASDARWLWTEVSVGIPIGGVAEYDAADIGQSVSAHLAKYQAPGAPPAIVAISKESGTIYRVRPGDTWAGISVAFYGDAGLYRDIQAANPQTAPESLRSGDELTIPPRP